MPNQKADSNTKTNHNNYEKPVLLHFGDVRDITLGGSGATPETTFPMCKANGQTQRDCIP